jgi:flagellar basal-body rod modification protein FlgD
MASTSVSSVSSQSGAQSSAAQASNNDAYSSLNLDTFMKLLVTEMQNQDPLEPMNNQEIVQQISQIRSIEASQQLTTTLQAVLLGQNVATASSLLGRMIAGLDDNSQQVIGRVDGVTIADGQAKLYVGNSTVSLSNVTAIAADSSSQ